MSCVLSLTVKQLAVMSVGGRGRADDSLDPMDPAAYSDVPRYVLHKKIIIYQILAWDCLIVLICTTVQLNIVTDSNVCQIVMCRDFYCLLFTRQLQQNIRHA